MILICIYWCKNQKHKSSLRLMKLHCCCHLRDLPMLPYCTFTRVLSNVWRSAEYHPTFPLTSNPTQQSYLLSILYREKRKQKLRGQVTSTGIRNNQNSQYIIIEFLIVSLTLHISCLMWSITDMQNRYKWLLVSDATFFFFFHIKVHIFKFSRI